MDPLDQTDPRLVGGCRLLARIGSGGMGRVYLGLSPGGEPRAVKTARSELSEDPTFRARFAHEVRNARAVSGLWTVPVLDAGVEQSVPWMVTEYVAGPSLQDVLTHHGALPPHALYALTIQLSHALDAIHQAGLVHRDLKPSNVLLGSDGPRVIDFGIARAADNTSLTLTGFAIGSPGYLPPEQITDVSGAPSKRGVEPAGDVFSLAAVLVFAACGCGPFGEGAAPSLLYRVVHEEPALDGVPRCAAGCAGPVPAQGAARAPQHKRHTRQNRGTDRHRPARTRRRLASRSCHGAHRGPAGRTGTHRRRATHPRRIEQPARSDSGRIRRSTHRTVPHSRHGLRPGVRPAAHRLRAPPRTHRRRLPDRRRTAASGCSPAVSRPP